MLAGTRFMLVAALLGMSVAGTVRAEEPAYPEKCRANAMAKQANRHSGCSKVPIIGWGNRRLRRKTSPSAAKRHPTKNR